MTLAPSRRPRGRYVYGDQATFQAAASVRDMDFRESTPRITAPTLVIVGAQDPATLPSYGEEIQKMIKGSKLVSLDAAHLSNIEQPKAYTDAVLGFLR